MYKKWTMFGKLVCYLIVFGHFTSWLCVTGKKEGSISRTKRQISSELPRIVTNDGHLLFMTGVNHNITFRSSAGGFVNVDGKNLKDYFAKIPDKLKERLTSIETHFNSLSTSVVPRVNNSEKQLQTFHSQLDTLSKKVQNELSTKVTQLTQENQQLKSRLEEVEQRSTSTSDSTIANILTRLTTIEALNRNLDSSTTSSINGLRQNITRLEGRPRPLSSSSRRLIFSSLNRLKRRVRTLNRALRKNDCESNPCQNGGTCYDRYNGFHCNCPKEWTGETCADDVNECAEYTGTAFGCQNGGTCTNTPGGYSCTCTSDWHGLHCNTRHDDCTGASNAEICGHGTCINQPRSQPGQPKFTCICDAGWTHASNSVTCSEDVDECQSSHSCFQHPSVHCINYPGGFQCSPCPPGYTGNGFVCNDVNECEINNGGCSLDPRVTCTNTIGSRTCGSCPRYYSGDGITCQYVGVCHIDNGGCNPLATCTPNSQVFGNRICTCPNGFVGSGIGPRSCRRLAPTENPCLNNPCQNGGTCQVPTVGNYTCLCPSNFTGSLCETRVDYCASNPCQNGGTCTLTSDSYACQCTSAYSGTRCESQREDCGGRFTNPSGTISFPSEPGESYPHSIDCEWMIMVASSKMVQLNFTNLHTECHYDWLHIIDSEHRYGNRIGRYCNLNDIPNNGIINSTGRGILLWFHSDRSVAYEGFNVSWITQDPQCGYDIRGKSHGLLNSPGYPHDYPIRRTCQWTISMDPGKRISIMFTVFRMEYHYSCNYDYLEIRDGLTPDSPLLGKFCHFTLPPPMISSGPYLYLKFQSDSSSTDKGFNMIFTSIQGQQGCGGVLMTKSGTVSSPNFPNPYSSNEDCVWIIQPGHSLTLSFNNIDLPGEPPCTTDYLEIRDGSTPTSPLIGRYCGQIIPPEIISNKNSLWLKFKTGQASSYVGFSLNWRIACGGVFINPSGILETPFYGTGSDNSSDELCVFLIRQPSTKKISLLFNEFGESQSNKTLQNCTSDYVEIRHGDTKSSPLLGKYCGSDNLPQASVGQGLMRIEYKGGPNSLGFSANYSTNDLDCGGILYGKLGTFRAPIASSRCVWNIIVDPDKLIRITFTHFHFPTVCLFNYLALQNEGDAREQRYCGSEVIPLFTSTSNRIRVTYLSSDRGNYFQAVFHAINRTNACGGILHSTSGVVTSPNFPENYPRNVQCIWSIIARVGNRIQLNFTDFELLGGVNCKHASLAVGNGEISGFVTIGKYCGRKEPFSIISHGNKLVVKFLSGGVLATKKGFRFSFSTVHPGCGGDILSPSGVIISPKYPRGFYKFIQCAWHIHVSAGNRIAVTFLEFQFGSICGLSNLEIRDPDRHGRTIAKYCQKNVPLFFVSSTNGLFILLNLRNYWATNHFRISYRTVCENIHLNELSGHIESPGFPDGSSQQQSCSWIISSLYNSTITIQFSHFNLPSFIHCQYAYLRVRDGDKSDSPVFGEFCSDMLPRSITSTGSKLRIEFYSGVFRDNNRFRLEYRQNVCIKEINSPSNRRHLPRSWFPKNYGIRFPSYGMRDKKYCIWKIKMRPGTRVKVEVSTLKLDGFASCPDEYLKISDGYTLKAPVLTTLCHSSQQGSVVTATSNKMIIQLKVKKSTNERRLRARITFMEGGCGGTYKLVSGSITSPNYPHNYPHKSDCSWLIVPKVSHLVVLKFDDFQLASGSNCTNNYLRISQNDEVRVVFCNEDSVTGRNFTFDSPVLVEFKTNNEDGARGFKMNYTQECGRTLSASDGGILSSLQLLASASCRWILIANHSDERITLHFSKFSSSLNCDEEYVKIYNGFDEMAPLIDTYCGRGIPPQVTSSGSALYIVANKGRHLVFHATYTTSVSSCGGEIFASKGAISTPNYPETYPINVECFWIFKIFPGNKIHLSFSEFSLENYEFCNKDYLEARNNNIRGSLIGRFCNEKPQNITSNGNLWLKFRSDESNTRNGFVANYVQIFGGSITGTSGQIGVPDWDPLEYPAVWTITVADNRVVFMSIIKSLFFIFEGQCLGYLEIRDGPTSDSLLIGKYCKDERINIHTSSNTAYLKYVPFRNYKQEFLISWRAITNFTAKYGVDNIDEASTPECTSNIIARSTPQNLTSPGFPNGYKPNLRCKWLIYAQEGFRIQINFTTVDLESTCDGDYVMLRRVEYGNRVKICGNNESAPAQVHRSLERSVSLTFRSDWSISGQGFSATFKRICGGEILVNPTWRISSHFVGSDCEWILHTADYRQLQVKIILFEYGNQCTEDFLKITNGRTASSLPMYNTTLEVCQNHNQIVTQVPKRNSNGIYVYIRLRKELGPPIKIFVSRKGLDCGGHVVLNNVITSGYLQSIDYPNSVECVWIITAPSFKRIQIDFEDIDLPGRRYSYWRCRRTYLQFRDGTTQNSPQIIKVCDRNLTVGAIYSTNNVIYVKYRNQHVLHEGRGFRIKYSIAKCGGKITALNGRIKSLNYPRNYDNNLNCKWTISVGGRFYISLVMLDFKLEESLNCTADYLEIKENVPEGESILFRGCGRNIPDQIQSTTNEVEVTFKTNEDNVDQGFLLNFTGKREECGGTFENDFGTITTPGYPKFSEVTYYCSWYIKVRPDRRIQLQFAEDVSLDCQHGKIYISDASHHRIGRFCSPGLPLTIDIFTNDIIITFHAFRAGYIKFSLSYNSDEERLCGGRLTSSSGNISSPSISSDRRLVVCKWLLESPFKDNRTTIIKLDVNTGASNCYWRKIAILEGVDEKGPLITIHCSETKHEIIMSSSPTLFIMYHTRDTVMDNGFTLTYNSTDCGGVLTGDSGVITSPNYPSPFPPNTYCYWKIKGPPDLKINITIMELNLTNNTNCEQESLKILNGGYWNSPLIIKMCGRKNRTTYITETNEASILFQSSNATHGQRFRIMYVVDREFCGGYRHGLRGRITSPNYPNDYPPQQECIWKFKHVSGYITHFYFREPFSLERSIDCVKDYVMVEGRNVKTNAIQQYKFCEYESVQNKTFNLTDEVTITFKSNNRISGNGFLLEWRYDCDRYFDGPSGFIYSPNYPGYYPHNAVCNYRIVANTSTILSLTFMDFALEKSRYCSRDRLRIIWYLDSCGTKTFTEPLKLFGSLTIIFRSNSAVNDRGFKLYYEKKVCHKVYTAPFGTIESEHYGNKYLSRVNCTYTIKVREGRAIFLKFTNFKHYHFCHTSYLAIYDGDNTSARLIGKFCDWPTPKTIISTNNTLLLQMRTNEFNKVPEFKAVYQNTFAQSVGCGGNLGNSTGLLTSIDIDNDGYYEEDIYCHWVITVDADKIVQLTFESFDIESSPNCEKDSLTILHFNEKEKYCGFNIPGPITSIANVMEVWFKTDATINRSGFRATYASILNFCGGVFNATETAQTIASPTRASLYQPHHGTPKCRWTVVAPDNYQIMINITQMDILPNCSGEYLLINDLPPVAEYKYKYCGSLLPPIYYSRTSKISIDFITQALGESEKFTLQYQLAGCNRNYTSASGEIFSPGWPNNYMDHAKCNMSIKSPVGTKLSLYFNEFKVEEHSRCIFDYLQVKYFTNSTTLQTMKLCHSMLPNPIFAWNNTIDLYFKSDSVYTRDGYHLIYTSTTQDNGCGGNLTGINGTFTSPNYPGFYPDITPNNTISQNKECQWNIRVPAERQISLSFAEFSLAANSNVTNCVKNHVKIYIGLRSRNTLYSTECNDDTPIALIKSTSNVMTVVMASDGVARTPKFRIRYTS